MTKYYSPNRLSKKSFPISKSGLQYIYAFGFITIIFSLLNFFLASFVFLFLTFFTCFFFRDPDRLIPVGDKSIVSPADGKIIEIKKIDYSPYLNAECFKISIFMSIFNVHINRTPVSGLIKKMDYQPGKHFVASLKKSSSNNERNALVIETNDKLKVCLVQIAGFVARRIICGVKVGDFVKKGQRYGLICFGSRLDFYLPLKVRICVKVGDRVLAGSSVLGEM